MDLPEKYRPSTVLGQVADHLQAQHSDLQVTLSGHHVTYEEALSATLDCIHGLGDRILLPTSNPARREALRAQALENKRLWEETTPFSSSRPIRTTGKLRSTDLPKPLSPERRALLKKKAIHENTPPLRQPYVIGPRALRTEDALPGIVGNATIAAVDWEDGMPQCQLVRTEMLWDTGAATTIVTRDLLDEKFQAHLSDPIHEAYKSTDGTRVRISFALEFSNSLIGMDVIAWVVDKEAVPNARSGVILGQKGCIDALQYRSIPRSISQAKGQAIDETLWGDLVLESYIDLDGVLKEVD